MVLLADIMAIKADKQGGKRGPGSSSRHPEPPSSSSSRQQHHRRPLKTVRLAPPDFLIQPHILVDSYLEKDVRYLGLVSHIPADLDTTNRTDVLRHVDRGKREEKVPCVPSIEHDAIFSLSIYNVKISRRDGKEEVYIRLPIHKIGAVCYIRDDDQHLLCIKFGDFAILPDTTFQNEMCQLAVLTCDTRQSAEELCSLINQTFQLVYTDATIQYLDTKLCEAAAGMSLDTSTIRSERSAPSTPGMKRMTKSTGNLAFMSHSSLDLDQENGGGAVGGAVISGTLPARRSSSSTTAAHSDSDISTTAQEQLKEYVYKKLYKKLSNEELQIFATLVNKWKNNMAFPDFCDKIMDLYGPHRKHLLSDMRPFIPEADRPYFESFLERVGLPSHPSWHALTNEPTVFAQAIRRLEGMGGNNNNYNNSSSVAGTAQFTSSPLGGGLADSRTSLFSVEPATTTAAAALLHINSSRAPALGSAGQAGTSGAWRGIDSSQGGADSSGAAATTKNT